LGSTPRTSRQADEKSPSGKGLLGQQTDLESSPYGSATDTGTRGPGSSATANEESPLEYMLAVMRNPQASDSRRDDMARAAAPYVHSRRSSQDAEGADGFDEPAAMSALELARWVAYVLAKGGLPPADPPTKG
jgi:hypothetical protein